MNNLIRTIDNEDNIIETSIAGVPNMFKPQAWDIAEELDCIDAVREYQRDLASMMED